MAQGTLIHTRVPAELKKKSEKILDDLGLSMGEAIRIYLARIVAERGIPFEIKQINALTQKTIADANAGIGLSRPYASMQDFIAAVQNDDAPDE